MVAPSLMLVWSMTLLSPPRTPVIARRWMRTGVPSCLAAASDVADQEGDNDSAAPPIRPFGGVGRRVLVNVEGLDADGEDLGLLLQGDGMRLLAEAKLEAELSLTLCDSPFIRDLNSQWRGMDQETDVLSFPMDDDVILGDVVICVEVARRQAAERAYDLRDEARVLMVHGLLHLLGYDHETGVADAAEMREAEERLLRNLGWKGEGLIAAAETDRGGE